MTEPLSAEQELAALLADLFSREELLQLLAALFGDPAPLPPDATHWHTAAALAWQAIRSARVLELFDHITAARPGSENAVFRVRCEHFHGLEAPSDALLLFATDAAEEAAAVTDALTRAGLIVALANEHARARIHEGAQQSKHLLVLVDLRERAQAWLLGHLDAARARGQPTLLGVVGRVADADLPRDTADEVLDLRALSRQSTPDERRAALEALTRVLRRAVDRLGRGPSASPSPPPGAAAGPPATTWWTRPRPPWVIRGLGLGLLVAGLATPWGVWAAGWLDAPASPAPEVAVPVRKPTKPPTEPPPAPSPSSEGPPPDWKRTLVAEATALRPALLRVPSGTFTMGSPEGVGYDDEHPAHPVTLPSFLVCETEVTQAHYKEVVGTSPSECGPNGEGCGDDYPVNQVSWNDACAYMNTLTERENAARATDQPALTACYVARDDTWEWRDTACTGYRLPTEAEWEYVARAGTTTAYSFGDDPAALGEHAWFVDNGDIYAHPVGKKLPNPWGLVDIHGNVWEWCWDWFGSYSNKPSKMPKGPDSGVGRVLRGGSFYYTAGHLRSAYRGRLTPSLRLRYGGFRCVRASPSSVDP